MNVASQKEEGSLCPSRALVGEEVREEEYVFLQMRYSAWVRGWKGGIRSLLLGWPQAHQRLGPTQKAENGAYNISPITKIFRPRKIRLTRKDVGMNSSCPPLAPR